MLLAGIEGLGELLLAANATILVATLMVRGPVKWNSIQRLVGVERQHHDRIGPMRKREVAMTIATHLALPLLSYVFLLICRQLLQLTGIDQNQPGFYASSVLVALVLVAPLSRGLYSVCLKRPFILFSCCQIFVFVYETSTLVLFKALFTALNVNAMLKVQ